MLTDYVVVLPHKYSIGMENVLNFYKTNEKNSHAFYYDYYSNRALIYMVRHLSVTFIDYKDAFK